MPVNKSPFVRSRNKDGKESVFRGPVQAGATQAIKRGELCVFNKTSGQWVPVSAVADSVYALAMAREEQKAADLARYIEFYSLHPADEFEMEIDAARALALGDTFLLTASNSQKLTYSATGFPVARCVDDGHYPEVGTTIRNRSYAVVSFNTLCSAWGLLISGEGLGKDGKLVARTADLTLTKEMDGTLFTNTGASGAVTLTLPQSCPAGTRFRVLATVAQDFGFDPGAAGGIYVEGAQQTDDKKVTVDAIGDALEVVADGNGDWLCFASISSAADQTAAIDVEA